MNAGTDLRQQAGFVVKAIALDNNTNQWLYNPESGFFTPPFTVGRVIPLAIGAQSINLRFLAPAGTTQGPIVKGQTVAGLAYDTIKEGSPGTNVAPVTQLLLAIGAQGTPGAGAWTDTGQVLPSTASAILGWQVSGVVGAAATRIGIRIRGLTSGILLTLSLAEVSASGSTSMVIFPNNPVIISNLWTPGETLRVESFSDAAGSTVQANIYMG